MPGQHEGPEKAGVFLPYLKAYAALIGSIATALLGVYAADTELGKILTVVAIVATVVATWAVPNLDPAGDNQDESVQPPASGVRALLEEKGL